MSEALQQLIRQAEAQKIQLQMNLQYQHNLELFAERMPSIGKLVKDHQAKKLVLKLDHGGKINLLDQTQRSFLYNHNPQDFCRRQVEQFQKHSNVRRFRISKNKEYNATHLHIRHLNQLIDAYQKDEPQRLRGTPTFIPTLIVSGVGLGYHLIALVEKFDIQNIIVYEKCVDSFQGSLHVIDWRRILDYFRQRHRSISLCIGVEPRLALAQIESTIQRVGLHSQVYTFVYRHSMRKAEMDFIEFYQKELRAYVGGIGYYDDEQIGLAHAYHNLLSDRAVFVSTKTHSRKTRLLLIGNGPSLDEHKDYIEKNRDKAIVMSCGTSLSSLLRMGIKPDFHVEMERCILVNDIIKYSSEKNDRDDITLLCLHTVAPETIEAFADCCYAIKSNDAGGPLIHDYFLPQKTNELIFCNPTVANCGLSFAVSMGFEDIHLVGIDFGVRDGKKHHSQHSIYVDMEKQLKEDEVEHSFFHEHKAIYCNGNFGGRVMANPVLNMARVSMERYLKLVQPAFPNLRCTNTNNGARIEGTITKKLGDLEDCQQSDKFAEIRDIKSSHFHYHKNQQFEKLKKEEVLAYFYSIKDKLKLSCEMSTDAELYHELRRAYGEISKQKDVITHYLMRGSLNSFFGAIVENTMYCASAGDFKARLAIGVTQFNHFIDKVYEKMSDDPFKLDETDSPLVQKMDKAKSGK